MFPDNHYVPILNARVGELRGITSRRRKGPKFFTPLIDVPAPGAPRMRRKRVGDEIVSVTEHPDPVRALLRLTDDLSEIWGTDQRFLIDLTAVGHVTRDGRSAHEWFRDEALSKGLRPVAVLRVGADQEVLPVPDPGAWPHGFAVRAVIAPGDEPGSATDTARRVVSALEQSCPAVSFIVDFGKLERWSADEVVDRAAAEVATACRIGWSSVSFASTSVPRFDRLAQRDVTRAARADWTLWTMLRRDRRFRRVSYSDYGALGPAPARAFGRRGAPRIHYSGSDRYSVWRGNFDPSFKTDAVEYEWLCSRLLRAEKIRAGFCDGDQVFYRAGRGTRVPTNRQEWVSAATNRHLALVERDLESVKP